jgi:hypothetical protein
VPALVPGFVTGGGVKEPPPPHAASVPSPAIKISIPSSDRHFRRRAGIPSSSIHASAMPLAKPATFAVCVARFTELVVEGAVVLNVTVELGEIEPEGTTTEAGAIEHVGGAVPPVIVLTLQLSAIVPVYPPEGVTSTMDVAEPPGAIVVGLAAFTDNE